MPDETERLKALILYKLARKDKWGEAHTDIAHLQSGVPGNLRGDMKRLADELLKDGFLIPKPTAYGFHVSLNPKKRTEIEALVRRYFG